MAITSTDNQTAAAPAVEVPVANKTDSPPADEGELKPETSNTETAESTKKQTDTDLKMDGATDVANEEATTSKAPAAEVAKEDTTLQDLAAEDAKADTTLEADRNMLIVKDSQGKFTISDQDIKKLVAMPHLSAEELQGFDTDVLAGNQDAAVKMATAARDVKHRSQAKMSEMVVERTKIWHDYSRKTLKMNQQIEDMNDAVFCLHEIQMKLGNFASNINLFLEMDASKGAAEAAAEAATEAAVTTAVAEREAEMAVMRAGRELAEKRADFERNRADKMKALIDMEFEG